MPLNPLVFQKSRNFSGWFPKVMCADTEIPAASTLGISWSGTRLTLSWSAVAGATGYQFYYWPLSDPYMGQRSFDAGAATSFTVDLATAGLPRGVQYAGSILAYNGSCFNYSKMSNSVTVTVP